MPGYPFVRLRGDVAILGLDTAIARPAFLANGLVGRPQRAYLSALLRHPELRSRYLVVLMHHPPARHPRALKELESGLLDRSAFVATLLAGLEGRGALVLSGHWHERHVAALDQRGQVTLHVAPSASHLGGGLARLGSYSLFDIGVDGTAARAAPVMVRAYDPASRRVESLG
jgi:3',5'-cyclic AMP phosphodiesterase CpdA